MNELLYRTSSLRLRLVLLYLLVLTLVFAAQPGGVRGQVTPPDDSPTASPPSSPTATPSSTPIPLAEVVTQAETVLSILRNVEADLASDQVAATIENELSLLKREIDARIVENEKILNARPSLETLRNLETDWQTLADKIAGWKRDLTTRATALDREINRLTQMEQTWSATLSRTQSSQTSANESSATEESQTGTNQSAPQEIIQRMTAVIASIKQTRSQIEARRAQILTLQNRVAEQDTRIADALTFVGQVRDETINRLFIKDSPAIWSSEVRSRAGQNLLHDSQSSFVSQWTALSAYARRQWPGFMLHGVILVLLAGAFYWARKRVQPWVVAEPSLEGVARVFHIPIATAIVLSILMSGWLYPQAPRLLTAILGVAALVPTIIILRQLVERPLFPILNALVIFYLMDLLRGVATSLPLLSRLLFLVEMLGGLIFMAWLSRSASLSQAPAPEDRRLLSTIKLGARVAGLVFLATFTANALGFVSIASLAGNALLSSAYIAVIFYAAVRIADGLIMFASRVRPLRLLGMVHRHRSLLRRRMRRVLQWVAIIGWFILTLDFLSLRGPVTESIRRVLSAELGIGAFHVSLGNIIAFLIAVWAAFLISRFLRFLLDEDVYPRVNLGRGIPYATSTVLHYVILVVGFFVAVAALGIDMTKFTIIAGAFGVGLGFGLQNIVNNFVSGLILLFERPVNVGDMIQVGDRDGELRHIGLRASVIRTLEGSEVIVPNGQLISEEVMNWTLSDQQRRIEISVGVAYGTDPELVIELLTAVAANHADVMKDPAPETLFVGFGDSALDFLLRAWTNRFERWVRIRSELTIGVNAALRDAGISIPFPQRDLHIQSVDLAVLKPEIDPARATPGDSGSPSGKKTSMQKKND